MERNKIDRFALLTEQERARLIEYILGGNDPDDMARTILELYGLYEPDTFQSLRDTANQELGTEEEV